MQVAALQMTFDKNGAIGIFKQIVDLGKSQAPEAAYNELLLLFQEGRFADLISRAPVLTPLLSDERKVLLDFCLGRSHFKLEHYSDAIVHYERFIQNEKEGTSYKRAAFLTLINCSQKVQDTVLFDRILQQFLTAFPGDEEAGKALLLHAQNALQTGNVNQATADLGKLLSQFPNTAEKETLLYDHALLL